MKVLLMWIVIMMFSGVAYADSWVYVKDGEIVRWQKALAEDTLKQRKLESHGYIPVVEEAAPKYDSATQSVGMGYRIEKNQVVRYFTVAEKPLDEARATKKFQMEQRALSEISTLLRATVTVEDIDPVLKKIKLILTEIADAKSNDDIREVDYEKAIISK
jgi:hypothetical protein